MISLGNAMTADEVALALKISRAQVYKLHHEGKLRARHKILNGKTGWRWQREDVEKFFADRELPWDDDSKTPRFVPMKRSELNLTRRKASNS